MSFFGFFNHWWNVPFFIMLGLVAVSSVLALVSVVRVPFTVGTLFLFAGISGLALNRVIVLKEAGDYPPAYLALSLAASLAIGFVGVRLFSRLARKLVVTEGERAPRQRGLTGRTGVVTSASLSSTSGEVRVAAADGHEQLVHARTAGSAPELDRGARVVLLEYDAEHDLFRVAPVP